MAKYQPPEHHRVFSEPVEFASSLVPPFGEFGPRPGLLPGQFVDHDGIDLNRAEGDPVRAAAPGVVTAVIRADDPSNDGSGNAVWVKHLEDDGWKIQTGYHHLADIAVSVGDVIERDPDGELPVVGTVGQTGNADGPHLCFHTLIWGVPFNPRQILRDYGRS